MRKIIILPLLFLLVSCTAKQPGQTFSDVPPGNPFYEYVERATKAGVMEGYGNGKFGVDDEIIRWQAAVAIEKALGAVNPPCSGTVFKDVLSSDAHCGYIEDLAKRKIT